MKKDKKFVKKIAACMTVALMAGGLIACGGSGEAASSESAASETASEDAGAALSGKISLAGSTSMEKLCEAMSESFMEANPGVTVTVEYTGSSSGIETLVQGGVDIGNASRNLKDGEKEKGAVENIVAIDGIAVIVDKDNAVKELTSQQLADIYTGKITKWSELGGSDDAIVVIGREAASGTRGAFEELLEVEDACNYAQELDSTGAVLAKVASTPGSIGYISLDALDDTVQGVSLDGAAPTVENITSGNYKLSRPFVMATKGEISEQSELVQAWFSYIASEEGQAVVSGVGLILPQ